MDTSKLSEDYPWTSSPIIACAPLLRIALAPLAVAVSRAGGLGFLAGGSDTSDLEAQLANATEILASNSPVQSRNNVLPIGVGFLNWGANLEQSLKALEKYTVAAAWFYAPYHLEDLEAWSKGVRRVSGGKTRVWIQVGTVGLALKAVEVCKPDVIVVQGHDAGGHSLAQGAGIISLLPEVVDAFTEREIKVPVIAAGGIANGRGVAACLALGAVGVAMGTRFLTATEAEVQDGYRNEVIRATDGGVSTVRSMVYDHARGIFEWPKEYNGRGLINKTYEDAIGGMEAEENKRLYDEALKNADEEWGPTGRLTSYAGTAVGLIRRVATAEKIIHEVTNEAITCLTQTASKWRRTRETWV